MGFFDHALGQSAKIVVAKKASPEQGTIARTQEFFKYQRQPGILMIDHDHDPSLNGTPVCSVEDMMNILCTLAGGFKNSAYCARGPLSAGVHRIGERPKSGRGFHLYIPVLDASDIPRVGKSLFRRLWLAGYGHIDLAANGAMLVRAIIDASVFSAERLDFVGPPIVGEGLQWTPPTPIYREGNYFDTQEIPDLDTEESEEFALMVIAAKKTNRVLQKVLKIAG